MKLFEIAYWAAMLAEIFIRAPINQKRKQEKISEQRVSSQEKIILILLSIGGFLLPLIYSATSWLDFANYTTPAWAGWAGILLAIGAVIVFWRAHADLGLNWSPSLEIREKHELITHGIYKFIRHPMYASQWLLVIAQPLLLQNWLAGFMNLIVFVPFYLLRVKAEEKMMQDLFGDEYSEYLKKTGAVLPKLR
ncbi:MAG: protein-S-isoprenylcysteine O-methyltransferase [Anaerolineales bacterium]